MTLKALGQVQRPDTCADCSAVAPCWRPWCIWVRLGAFDNHERERAQDMANYGKRAHGTGQVRWDAARGLWRGQVTIDGKRRSVSARTEGEARAKLDKLLTNATDADQEDAVWTLGGWLAHWVDEAEGSANTVANRQWAIAHLSDLHKRRIDRVSALDVEAVLKAKQRGGLGRSSLVRIRTVLNMALDEAMRHHVVSENVAKVVRIPKHARGTVERRALSVDEVGRLLEAAEEDAEGIVVVLGYYLGMRPGEVCGLLWSDVDLEAATLTVSQMRRREPDGTLTFCDPKADSTRTFTNVRPEVLGALKRHKSAQSAARLVSRGTFTDRGLVVCHRNGRPIDPDNHRRAVTRMAVAAGIFGGLTPNELRHTFATHTVASGKSLTELAVRMGHKNERMGMLHYNHPGRIVDMSA
jgi:integrase